MSWRVERRWIISTSLQLPKTCRVIVRSFGSSISKSSRCHVPRRRLAVDDRDRMRGGRQEHRLHVGMAVLALVRVEVLGPELEVVVPVVRALVRDQLGQVTTEVVEARVLPLVDEQGTGGVRAERDDETLRDARILDRTAEVVGEVEERVPLGRRDHEARGDGLQRSLPSAAGVEREDAALSGRFSALIPRIALDDGTRDREPDPVPPSPRPRAWSAR